MIQRSHWAGLLVWLASGAIPGFCQADVAVTVKPSQPEYLVGEPVFVVVEMTNVGTEPVGYWICESDTHLTVPNGRRKRNPNLHGCFAGEGGGSGCGVYDPPTLASGKSVSFRYLLKGYRLESGEYDLHATGKAGAGWYFGWGRNESSVSNRKQSDPVEGAVFDVWLKLNVREGTEDELRERYVPYVEQAKYANLMVRTFREARAAIAEMAPPFLEKTILSFADQQETANLAAEGLGQIPTTASRADLIALFNKSADLRLRGSLLKALAGIATDAEMPFFASLLPGHSSALDDDLRRTAALGIGKIGGENAVKMLTSAFPGAGAGVREAMVEALGNTRSAAAVPVLIGMYADETVQNDVCGALSTLTHRTWCDGTAPTPADAQVRWWQWWGAHQSGLTLYDTDQCVDLRELVPLID